MASVHDVAAYILDQQGAMSAMKLQKLVYYSQAWHLAWTDEPLFDENIEAWANGPVVYDLYQEHRGKFTVGPTWRLGRPDRLTQEQRGVISEVLSDYGHMDARKLSYLTHAEQPWRLARGGLQATAISRNVISKESMRDYYAALDADEEATPVGELEWPGWDGDDDGDVYRGR
jgi:uncharacterized phage-associated protein